MLNIHCLNSSRKAENKLTCTHRQWSHVEEEEGMRTVKREKNISIPTLDSQKHNSISHYKVYLTDVKHYFWTTHVVMTEFRWWSKMLHIFGRDVTDHATGGASPGMILSPVRLTWWEIGPKSSAEKTDVRFEKTPFKLGAGREKVRQKTWWWLGQRWGTHRRTVQKKTKPWACQNGPKPKGEEDMEQICRYILMNMEWTLFSEHLIYHVEGL